MKKMILPGIVSGIAMILTGMFINMPLNALFPAVQKAYSNAALFRPWSDPLMSIFFLAPLWIGFVFAWAYPKVKKHLKGPECMKGLKLGTYYLLIATVPGMFITYSSFQVTVPMTLSWVFFGWIQYVVGGIVVAKIMK